MVIGLGFNATLILPPTAQAAGGQYPIGDAEQWRKIVENLAVLVKELDATFVPGIEKACRAYRTTATWNARFAAAGT